MTDRQECFKCHETVTGNKKLSKCSSSRCHSITNCGVECQEEDWPRHMNNYIPVMVTEIEGKGRGLVASRDKMGELLFLDKTVIKLSKHISEPDDAYKSLMKQMGNPPSEAMLQFYKLPPGSKWSSVVNRSHRTAIKELEIYLHNSKTVDDFWILFVNAALLNHSCGPNAANETFVPKDKDDLRVEVRATKDINKGEEITIFYNIYKDYSYKVFGSTIEERKIAIKKNFDFDCKCCVCSGSVPGQEDIIKELLELHGTLECDSEVFVLGRSPQMRKIPQTGVKKSRKLTKLLI